MAQLYADEDFSYPVIQRLRQLGHDILTAHEAGQADQAVDRNPRLRPDRAAAREVPGQCGLEAGPVTASRHAATREGSRERYNGSLIRKSNANAGEPVI